jgi:hypothetical protein
MATRNQATRNQATRTQATWYEVRYVGDNESVETVSRHRTLAAADAARAKLQTNPRYQGSNTRIAVGRDAEYYWL